MITIVYICMCICFEYEGMEALGFSDSIIEFISRTVVYLKHQVSVLYHVHAAMQGLSNRFYYACKNKLHTQFNY